MKLLLNIGFRLDFGIRYVTFCFLVYQINNEHNFNKINEIFTHFQSAIPFFICEAPQFLLKFIFTLIFQPPLQPGHPLNKTIKPINQTPLNKQINTIPNYQRNRERIFHPM